MTGRVEAEAPDTDVRIGLQRRAADGDDVRTTIRPARPNVAPISNVEDSDEAENTGSLSARTSRDDLEPPALEAEAMRGNDSGSRPSPQISASAGSSGKSSGWTQGHRPVDRSAAGQGGASGSGSGSAAGSSRASRIPQETDGDDEVNPLPPALEPAKVGSKLEPEDAPDDSIALARGQVSSQGQRRRTAPCDRRRLSRPMPVLMPVLLRPISPRRSRFPRAWWQALARSSPMATHLSR